MNRAMEASASGMAAQQQHLEVIADNLANADVAGFKGSAATFADVRAGAIGLGTTTLGRHALLTQGKLEHGGGPFDVAIDGAGFFVVERDGQTGYTRNGEFARGADGRLRNAAGWTLHGVRVPDDALSLRVERDGRVLAETSERKNVALGTMRLATFPAPEALHPLGGTMFAASDASGPAHLIAPGGVGGPSLAFGMLERSNVSVIESMMEILAAQRAYEANAKGVQAADEMLRIANNLHRS